MVFIAIAMLRMTVSPYEEEERKRITREEVTNRLLALNACIDRRVPLTEITGPSTALLCIQFPYLPKEVFEQSTGLRVPRYEMLARKGGHAIWWIVRRDGTQIPIESPSVPMTIEAHPDHGFCFRRTRRRSWFPAAGATSHS